MTWLIAVIGVFFCLVGLTGLVHPDRFRSTIGAMDSQPRFVFAVVIRLVMGALLWWLADELRHPQVMRILAIIAVAAAVVILVAGQKRLDGMIRWWLGTSDGVLRVSAAFAALFGVWLAWEAS